MESHPSFEELMSRPARQRRTRVWRIVGGSLYIATLLAYLLAFLFVPDWAVQWWMLVFIPVVILDVILLRRLESWWWSHSPWAWREV